MNRMLNRAAFAFAVVPRVVLPTVVVRSVVVRTAVVLAAVVLATSSALAHHSFAMFDQSKTITVQGAVKDFRWSNPHVFIELSVKNRSGADEEWSIEMTSPEHLSRAGWRPGTLKPGDKVTLNIHPMREGVTGGQYLSGTGPSGPLLGSPPAQPGQGK